MTKVKAGDLITVEAATSEYKRSRDFGSVIIGPEEDGLDFGDLKALSKKSIYRVVKGEIHPDIAKHKVNIKSYSVESERIKSFAFPDEGSVKVNGDYDIPFEGSKKRNLSETHFLDGNVAESIANQLNVIERDYLVELRDACDKGVGLFDQMIEKKLV